MHIEQVRKLVKQNRLQEAKTMYLHLLNESPTNKDVLNELGNLVSELGHRSAAKRAYQQAILHHPSDSLAYIRLANLLFEDGDWLEAKMHYEQALRTNPETIEGHKGMSYVLEQLGEKEKAKVHRKKAFEAQPILLLPYRGNKKPISVLLLVSAIGGNIPIVHLLDRTIFQTYIVYVEYITEETELPSHDIVLNAVGDADLVLESLKDVQKIVLQTQKRIINTPTAIKQTTRMENAERLAAFTHIITPKIMLYPRETLENQIFQETIVYPFLLRSPGYHTGQHFVKVERMEEMTDALAQLPGDEILAMPYIETRSADGMYRKYRVMMIDEKLYPLHVAISKNWKVHYFTADMSNNASYREEEKHFLEDMEGTLGKPIVKSLKRIQKIMGLEYAGIDFGISRTGELVVFETNATMIVPRPGNDAIWEYRRNAVEKINQAVQKMLTNH